MRQGREPLRTFGDLKQFLTRSEESPAEQPPVEAAPTDVSPPPAEPPAESGPTATE